jgi:nucleotide-binding universal stress UspA family protein
VATIVVGIEDSLRAQDAVALAGDLARASGAEVRAVCAYPFDLEPAAHYNLAMRAPLRDAAEATLERLCEPLSDLPVRRVPVADPSPARALIAVAADTRAAMIIVGSSHSGFDGRVRPGSTGRRLLHGAPCSLALAPQGHRLRPHRSDGRITVAFDGSEGVLSAARTLSRCTALPLRAVSVFAPDTPPPPWLCAPPGFLRITSDAERAARARLEAIEGVEPVFLKGDPAAELTRESEVAEFLVVGSRGYGPSGAVVPGGVSGRLVETAACPLVIVPIGVKSPLRALDEACGKLLTSPAV